MTDRLYMKGTSLTRFAWLSIAAVLTIGLKTTAWWITGSVGLLSDAMESVVNLVGGLMALAMLTVAERPADEDHPYGHGKAEYFSSGVEGWKSRPSVPKRSACSSSALGLATCAS